MRTFRRCLRRFCLTVDGGRISDGQGRVRRHGGDPETREGGRSRRCAGCPLADARRWRAAADAVDKDFTPLTDLRASAAYRRRVAANLVVKALAEMAGVGSDVTRIANRRMVADAAE